MTPEDEAATASGEEPTEQRPSQQGGPMEGETKVEG